MAKSVTVLALEGNTLRGVQLDAVGSEYVRGKTASWSLSLNTSAGDSTLVPDSQSGDSLASASGGIASVDKQNGASPDGKQNGIESADKKIGVESDDILNDPSDESVVSEDLPLVRAFTEARSLFGTNEFVLSLPLQRLLVKTVTLPAEARGDLLGAAQLELDGISPFPDEVLTPAAEIMTENEKELTSIIAALPGNSSDDISEALTISKTHVLRTDTTAISWLEVLWPRFNEKANVARRIVLLNLDDAWDLAVIDDDAPYYIRGIGNMSDPDELSREIMLSLLSPELAQREAGDVIICSRVQPAAEVAAKLGMFGPVRNVIVDDEFIGAEGAARRAVVKVNDPADAKIDITPFAWTEDRIESRFCRKLKIALSIAGGIWLAVMAVLFGVDTTYDFMAERMKSAQKERKHARAFKEVSAMTNRVVLIEKYAGHAHSALAVLKAVSDSLPVSEEMAFRSFQFRRNESVKVSGSAGEREELRQFNEELENATYDEDGEDKLFSKVVQTGGETQTKKGIRFAVECFFHSDDEGGRR